MHLIELKELLQEGNLRSDGLANDVVTIVLNNPGYFDELFDNLMDPNKIIRAHASDALEKVLRKNKDLLKPHLEKFLLIARAEKLSIAKMHYAKICAYFYDNTEYINEIISVLKDYLNDSNAFVISHAISALTIIAVKNHYKRQAILHILKEIGPYSSKAVQNRLQKALLVLIKHRKLPDSWIKI